MALDADTRKVVAMAVGDGPGAATARALWDASPPAYRVGTTDLTDVWEAYAAVLPADDHVPCPKVSGLTNHIERWPGTLRQRRSRLVRKALSFSKSDANLLGALWFFARLYSASLPQGHYPKKK